MRNLVSTLGLYGGAGLRITALPRPGDGYGLRADALRGSWRERPGGQGDDALVFVDPPASAAPEDALLDARIQAGELRFAYHRN